MKTLYISDMDGTLLNDGEKVSRRSVEIINELIKNGMLFTVAIAFIWTPYSPIMHKYNICT